jgi:hypothetical protein
MQLSKGCSILMETSTTNFYSTGSVIPFPVGFFYTEILQLLGITISISPPITRTPGANPTTFKFTRCTAPERFLNAEENIFVPKTH